MSPETIERRFQDLEGTGFAIAQNPIDFCLCSEVIQDVQRLKAPGFPTLYPSQVTGFEILGYLDLVNASEPWHPDTNRRNVLTIARGLLGSDMLDLFHRSIVEAGRC